MRFVGELCLGFVLLACGVTVSHAATAGAGEQRIDAVVQAAARDTMRQHRIPGLAIAVTADGRQSFYSYGVASKQTRKKVTGDTLFELGSISKTFTATLATYAQANGRLSLTDTPGKYFPELRGSPFDKVTLLNLATHSAGGFPLQVPDEVQDTGQLMDYFRTWRPTHAPGTYRTYANPSIGMLGMIAAKSMDMPYAQAVERQLFPRLGLSNSYINVPAEKMPLYAQGYDKQDAPVRVNPGILANEAYGVKSSARDLIRFVEANMQLPEAETKIGRAIADTRTGHFTVGPMTQDLVWEQYRYPVDLDALIAGNSNEMVYQSHAVAELSPALPPQEAVWINKTGSTAGFGAYVAFVPGKKLGIVILANRNYPNEARIRLAHRILSEFDRDLKKE